MQAPSFLPPFRQPAPGPAVRRRLDVQGRVQGVGFRPFAWRLAQQLGLDGHVGNSPQGAFVEIQGPAPAVAIFIERHSQELPEPGRVDALTTTVLPLATDAGFSILPSDHQGAQTAAILPDLDVCPDCLRELFDPGDRRFHYPFLNCTRCGPRYAVVLAVPYDRAATTLQGFPMCARCRAEYDDPNDRRFHAQPTACPDCGPRLWYTLQDGVEQEGDPVSRAAVALRQGDVVAVKGVGGFHLACRADDETAVNRLRQRKGREAKPFAVMVPDLETARRLVATDPAIETALMSAARPIVLAPKRADAGLAPSVAPDAGAWGLLLPSTPLHHLLLRAVGLPLVMTSGNPSGEPLCAENDEALERLGLMADGFLLHNRPIARRLDDSVVVAVSACDGQDSHLLPLRRARGYVPAAVTLARSAPQPVLAVGGEMKSAVCLLSGGQAVLSEHLGELDNPAAYRNFLGAIDRLQALLKVKPARLAADMHPMYAATRWAKAQDLPLTLVQHHHAHIVSCMAEHGLSGPVVGLACDGTGYGPDGSIWGGEILVCDESAWRRAGHLATFPLVGGDAAALDPWRPALGLLTRAFPLDWDTRLSPLVRMVGGGPVELAAKRLAAGQGTVLTSSLGRLFDGAAALLGFCERNRYEAEAAMILQHAAETHGPADALPSELLPPVEEGGPWIMDPSPLLRRLVQSGDPEALARGFHEGVAAMLANGALAVAADSGLDRVVLSGGCFANRLLLASTAARLRASGLHVFLHRHVPCGDGGLALGQAVVAAQATH